MRTIVLCTLLSLSLWCGTAQADLPPRGAPRPPRPAPGPVAPPKVKELPVQMRQAALPWYVRAKIILPRGAVVAQGALAPADDRAETATGRSRTILGGLLLSLAAVSGLGLVRGRARTKLVAVTATAACLAGVWNVAWANFGPPLHLRNMIQIEFTDDQRAPVTLILNANDPPAGDGPEAPAENPPQPNAPPRKGAK